MGLQSVLKTLDPTDLDEDDGEEAGKEEEYYKLEDLMALVPKLPESQAEAILIAAQEKLEADGKDEVSLSDAMNRIQKIDQRQEQLHVSVEQLIHMNEMIGDRFSQERRNREKQEKGEKAEKIVRQTSSESPAGRAVSSTLPTPMATPMASAQDSVAFVASAMEGARDALRETLMKELRP